MGAIVRGSSPSPRSRGAKPVIYDVAIKFGFWALAAAAVLFLAMIWLTGTHP